MFRLLVVSSLLGDEPVLREQLLVFGLRGTRTRTRTRTHAHTQNTASPRCFVHVRFCFGSACLRALKSATVPSTWLLYCLLLLCAWP